MMNSEARKKMYEKINGPSLSEHGAAAKEIAAEIDAWLVENQDFLLTMSVDEALKLVSWNMGMIVGGHVSR